MGKLHSFKRHLNAEKVQIAEAKAYDQAQAKKALAQERKENDSKLVQEVLEVVRKRQVANDGSIPDILFAQEDADIKKQMDEKTVTTNPF